MPAEEAQHSGGLAVGTCLMTSALFGMCGSSAVLAAAFCGAGHLLCRASGGGDGRRWVAAILIGCGFLLFWGSEAAWMVGLYAATAVGLGLLAAEREQLPDFLPYLLFAGYLLLFLLAPMRPRSHHVLLDVPGSFTLLEEEEEAADSMLPECAAVFTWGIVLVRWFLAHAELAPVTGRKRGVSAQMPTWAV